MKKLCIKTTQMENIYCTVYYMYAQCKTYLMFICKINPCLKFLRLLFNYKYKSIFHLTILTLLT